LRIGVHRDGQIKRGRDELRHERHPGGSADQQHRVEIRWAEPGGA
jgi:hypothetical protein